MTRLLTALTIFLASATWSVAQEPAGAAIVMAIDYSGSIKDDELEWQIGGLIDVFADPAVEEQIARNDRGWVAVTVFRYASAPELPPAIPWTVLRPGDGSVEAFRQQLILLAARGRDGFGATSTADGTRIGMGTLQGVAIEAALGLLAVAPPADRQIIDLQTDEANSGWGNEHSSVPARMERMRALAWAADVLLNVLVIGHPDRGTPEEVQAFHMQHTTTGLAWLVGDRETYIKVLLTKILGEMS